MASGREVLGPSPLDPNGRWAQMHASLERRLQAVERKSPTNEAWHYVGAPGEPPFLGSCSAGASPPGFYKDSAGNVHLQGTVNAAAGMTGSLFTLPAGYRPVYGLAVVAIYSNGSFLLQVTAAGDVVTVGNTWTYIIIDNIHFRTD